MEGFMGLGVGTSPQMGCTGCCQFANNLLMVHDMISTEMESKTLESLIAIFKKGFIYLSLERGEGREIEREKNIDVREKHQFLLHTPKWEPGPQPSHVPDWESNQ